MPCPALRLGAYSFQYHLLLHIEEVLKVMHQNYFKIGSKPMRAFECNISLVMSCECVAKVFENLTFVWSTYCESYILLSCNHLH